MSGCRKKLLVLIVEGLLKLKKRKT